MNFSAEMCVIWKTYENMTNYGNHNYAYIVRMYLYEQLQ